MRNWGRLCSSVSVPVGALGALLALEAALLVAAGRDALPAVRLREAAAQKVGVLEHALWKRSGDRAPF